MGYRIREVTAEDNVSRALSMEARDRAIPRATIATVRGEVDAEAARERTLTMVAGVLVLLAMHLDTHLSIEAVLHQLGQGLRFVWPDPEIVPPGKSALSYRRYQVGARPLAALFQRVCRPLTTPATALSERGRRRPAAPTTAGPTIGAGRGEYRLQPANGPVVPHDRRASAAHRCRAGQSAAAGGPNTGGRG